MANPFDTPVSAGPRSGQTFGNLGVGPDQVIVPETKVYRSEDGQLVRRYVAGDRVNAQEAALFGITPEVVGDPVPVDELSVEAAITFLRDRGYQVSPMQVAGPMAAALSDEALIAHVQEQGFEVQKPGEALPELEQPAAPDPDATTEAPVTDDDQARAALAAKRAKKEAEAEAKAQKPPANKREADPENKAEKAPEAKR